MKKILIVLLMMLSITLYGQERRIIKVDKGLYMLETKYMGKTLNRGYLKEINEKLIPHGRWWQYDLKGKLVVIVLYDRGKKVKAYHQFEEINRG